MLNNKQKRKHFVRVLIAGMLTPFLMTMPVSMLNQNLAYAQAAPEDWNIETEIVTPQPSVNDQITAPDFALSDQIQTQLINEIMPVPDLGSPELILDSPVSTGGAYPSSGDSGGMKTIVSGGTYPSFMDGGIPDFIYDPVTGSFIPSDSGTDDYLTDYEVDNLLMMPQEPDDSSSHSEVSKSTGEKRSGDEIEGSESRMMFSSEGDEEDSRGELSLLASEFSESGSHGSGSSDERGDPSSNRQPGDPDSENGGGGSGKSKRDAESQAFLSSYCNDDCKTTVTMDHGHVLFTAYQDGREIHLYAGDHATI
jgi:hypothetical protein